MKCPISLPTRYTVKSVCSGGQGNIFICEDADLQRDVAVKCMINPAQQDRLIDEIKALQSIASKHVVQIYDLLVDKSQIGVILEYVDGDELAEVDFNQLRPQDALKTLYQIAAGISDIHEQKHIHRDIKPTNMKIDSEGIVKIFDFGLAREQGVDDQTAGFRGTRGFAAPELYSAGVVNFTPAVDVYAFGATVWFLLTGSVPPELRKQPPAALSTSSLASKTQLIAASLADLVDKTLAIDPRSRPKMSMLKKEFERHLVAGRHEGAVRYQGVIYKLGSTSRAIKIGNANGLKIHYDDLHFICRDVVGDVYINNRPAQNGMTLPDSCVITIGSPGGTRSFVTFDISHPEVVL